MYIISKSKKFEVCFKFQLLLRKNEQYMQSYVTAPSINLVRI